MPTPLNFNGNDDNALEALVIDAGIAFTHSGNTHEAINALAAVVIYDLPFQGNDRQMLEAIAANAVIEPPFVYKLDDDGTLAAMLGADGGFTMIAPAYLRGTKAITAGEELWSLPAAISGAAPVAAGKIVAFELVVNSGPHDVAMTGSYLVGGGIAATNEAGTLINSVRIGYNITAAAVELKVSGPGVGVEVIETLTAEPVINKKVGVWVDTTTGEVFTNHGQIVGASLAGIKNLLPWLGSVSGGVTAVTGELMDVELIVNASEMTLTYPAGAIDIYGVEI